MSDASSEVVYIVIRLARGVRHLGVAIGYVVRSIRHVVTARLRRVSTSRVEVEGLRRSFDMSDASSEVVYIVIRLARGVRHLAVVIRSVVRRVRHVVTARLRRFSTSRVEG